MRYCCLLVISVLCYSVVSQGAPPKKRYRGEPRTEVELVNNVVGCLHMKDTASYYDLFPPFDTLWSMVLHNNDRSPDVVKALDHLREHPQSLIEFDPLYNHDIIRRFCSVLRKGEDSGINWGAVVLQRYELYKDEITSQNLVGYEKVAPERFKGYVFIRDVLDRTTFCVTITEIQKIRGYFFGGQVLNILEASTVDQYRTKEIGERQYLAWLAAHPDTAQADTAKHAGIKKGDLSVAVEDDDNAVIRKEVVDRKYYEGKLDEDISVKLYVRIMKDVKTGKSIFYDGLYKFDNQKNYIKLEITRDKEGKWQMEDDEAIGSFELELKDRIFSGTWNNNEYQTGYDATLKQTGLPETRLEQFDRLLDGGASSGKVEGDDGGDDMDVISPKDKEKLKKMEERMVKKGKKKAKADKELQAISND